MRQRVSNSHHASRSTHTQPAAQGGPPVFSDDPLVPGVTLIKAVHITELRTAVNQARSRAGLPAASWAESVSPGGLIKAAPIVELRARLDEARVTLGLSAASYTDLSLSVGMTVKPLTCRNCASASPNCYYDADMKKFYPEIEPFDTGRLKVSPIHELYYEQVGNPNGQPAVFLHGGPGSGILPDYRRFFDPAAYRVVLFEQRGAGRSTPHANLEDNTTWDLVADMERLREHLGIEKWLVFGGSWGSTLALAYAQTHPERVTALVLRGIFLCRPKEIDWFYQEGHGARALFPDVWEEYVRIIPEAERDDMLAAYHRRLMSDDQAVQMEAAKAWSIWEASTSKLFPDQGLIDHFGSPHTALSLARIECHYFVNNAFFDTDNYLIENVDKIRKIPAVIVQGRYDVVCPMMSAWDLHRAWPEADLKVVADAGHSATEPGITAALVDATDRFRKAG